MELGHWVTGSMGHLSRPGHQVTGSSISPGDLVFLETRVFPVFEKNAAAAAEVRRV